MEKDSRSREQLTLPGTGGSSVAIPDKLYFKIGEVCKITGTKQHVLRYWESEFSIIRPQRATSKQRLYRRVDVENILLIKKLLQEEGFTIAGARKYLSRHKSEQKETAAEHVEKVAKAGRDKPGSQTTAMRTKLKQELLQIKRLLERR